MCSRICSTGPRRSDQLVLGGQVDPVEALADDRRRRDADVHLGRAGFEQELDDLAGRVAADDRVVDGEPHACRRPRRAG